MNAKQRSEKNEEEANEVSRLRAPVVYTVIKREGEEELARPTQSLWWSGLAAGIGIFLSVIAMGMLVNYIPESLFENSDISKSLLIHLGYCVGFLVVILGRLQLFTENTITVVIPLLAKWNKVTLVKVTRLWTIVFTANMIGVFIAALSCVYAGIVPPDTLEGIVEVSKHYVHKDASQFLTYGIPAGFIIAALVWMLPSSDGFEFWVILVMTYLISLGGFTHVIAGAGEVFVALLVGEVSLGFAIFTAIIPTLIGNIIGGAMLFTVLAHGQVREEL